MAAAFIRALHATLRIRHVDVGRIERLNDAGRNYIIAFWHAHLLMMIYAAFARPIHVMISQHRDGELIARTMGLFGARSLRGSSTRGGAVALKAMIRAARAGAILGITPDGPRGPRHEVQPGVVLAAQAAMIPIMPIVFVARRKTLLRSWDRFEIPMPFSRALFVYGNPLDVPRDATREDVERLRLALQDELLTLNRHAEESFAELWKVARKHKINFGPPLDAATSEETR